LSFIVDHVTDVVDWVAGAASDITEFAFDEIIVPVATFVGDTVEAMIDNPVDTIALIAKGIAIGTGNAWAIPLIDGAAAAVNGEDVGDILKTVAISYVSQSVGREIAQHTAPFVDKVIGEALSEGVKEVAVQAITQGTVGAAQAILYGEDPLEAFARGGLTAAVSAGLGKIGEQMGWEMEVTDPETDQTTTKAIPNVVKNMIGATLAAELTGQEITPELMANALTRGLITTQVVRDYIVTNPDVGDREIGYIAAALQRTAAVALSGGTGEQAAAQLMGVLSAYGMEELHDKIENSGAIDFIGDTVDKISGDYGAVTTLADKIDVVGPRLDENHAEFKEKYDAIQTQWDALNEAKDRGAQLRAMQQTPGFDPIMVESYDLAIAAAETDFNNAFTKLNSFIDLGYNDDIKRLIPLIEADNALLTTLQEDIIVAQNNLQRDADKLDGELVPIFKQTQEYFVSAMDPGFNAQEYRQLNNLPDDVDPYTHFLTEGQHDNVYTNEDQYNKAKDQIQNTAFTQIIWEGFGVEDNSLARNLSQSDINTLNQIIFDAGYKTPQQLQELSNNTELQEAVFNQWVEAIGSDPSNTYQTGQPLTADALAILDRTGYDMREVAEGTPATAEEALALDQFIRGNSEDGSVISLGDGVTASDVVSGAAVITYTASGIEWKMPEEMTRWDPEAGWVTRRLVVNTAGEPIAYDWVDKDGNTNTNTQPLSVIITTGNDEYMTKKQQADIVFTAVQEGTTWDQVQESLGWSDALIDTAQNALNWAESTDTEFLGFNAQNFLANAMKAGGGILDAFNGMSTLFGIAPDSTSLGKFAQQLQDIGTAGNTEEYKEELGKLEAMMNAESDLPEDAAWYERAFDKVATIAGAAATHPSAFISEYIGVEALQELVPLAIGGFATLGAKGTAMAMGRTLSTRMAARTGLTAAAITDITESYGGSASEAYDRALAVALASPNPETGQLFTQEEAEKYAMKLAVQTGTVAATITAATMGIGGMALEKALLGDKGVATGFVAAGIDALASRAKTGATIMIKEGLTEALEEGLATAYREGNLHQIDSSIDISSEVAGAAFMGFLVGGPVSGGAYGVSQVGDMYSNFVSAVDPDVRGAIESGDVTAANTALDNLGVTDPTIRTNILSQVQPENYVNQAEATEAFINANPDYSPTQAEIDSYVQEGGQNTLDTDIDYYVDARYVDAQEVIAAAAAQGVTLTEEQAQEYVGQGPAGHETDVLEQIGLELGPGYTNEGEARAMFAALGYNPSDAEVASYVGNVAESTQEAAIGTYVDPRQVTNAEATALFANQNFEPSDADLAEFIGQGGANFETNANVTSYVDPRQVTTAEAEAFFGGLGYDATDAQIAQFAGQGTDTFETDQGSAVSTFVDPRMVSEAEARAAFDAQGYSPSDAEVAQYVAQGTSADTQKSAESNITSFADPRATTDAEVREMFASQGYTPTDAEVSARIAQGDKEFEATTGNDVVGYIDPRQVTEAEARAFFSDQGYTPSDAEVQAYMGQGGNSFETGQDSAVGTYVDPRQVTEAEAEAFFEDQGYTPTDEEVQAYIGQGDADFATGQDTAIGTYVDPRQVTEAEARAALAAQGIPEPTAEQIAEFVGQGDAEFESGQQEFAFEYADPFVTTYDEAKQFFNDLGFTPTKEEIEAYVGATTEETQKEAIAAFVDPRYTDADEAREFLTALGYDPSDEEVARFTGQVREEQQAEAIGEYVDPRQVTDEEARQFFADLGYNDPTDEQVAQFVAQVKETTQQDVISKYIDPRQVTRAEVQAIADEEGLTLTDALAAAYVGQSEADTFQTERLDAARTEYDPLATTVDEATQFFADTNYTATPEEIAQFVASKTEEVQTSAIGAYVDPRQITSDEAEEFFSEIGYNPADQEVADFTGQLNDKNYQVTQKAAIDEYVDPRYFDVGEVRAAYEELGLVDVAQEDIDRFVGQYEFDFDAENDGAGFQSAQMDALRTYMPTATFNVFNQIMGSPAVPDDPNTDVDESKDATGVYAELEAGATRDEALQAAIDKLATDMGVTKDALLDEIGLTEDRLRDKIDAVIDDVEGVKEGVEGVKEGVEGVKEDVEGVKEDVDDIGDQITDVEKGLTEDIDAVSNLVGKPAAEVTQTDIDFVIDLIAGQQVIEENQQDLFAQYDVTGDGQITIDDQTLLEQLLAGDQVYDQVADTSIYAPTGVYDVISDTETNLTDTISDTETNLINTIDQNRDQTTDAITKMEQNIVTNIEDEALRAGGRQFLQQALQAPDAAGQQVTVKQPDPLNLRYIYDFNSIFANPQQAGMFPSPYAKGGQVDDTTDKLLNIIGAS